MAPAFVFGYGSLLRRPAAAGPPVPCRLRDHRRGWGVAMDNTRTIPGYKYYVDMETGERPEVYVAFLDIRPEPDSAVNGVVFPVTDEVLASLDRRERNYDRREVTDLLDADLGGRVWAYVGSAGGRRRYETGRGAGTAVVSGPYLQGVRDDFGSFGADMAAEFEATTERPDVPVVPLKRIAVPDRGSELTLA
jgi:gamma-glutamylcyclotransferase (GGCT)/AIG2-like uncharacterized protein YtfP